MVSSEDKEVFGVFDLVSEEQANGFERLFTAVHVITKEEIVSFGRETTVFEEP